MGKVRQDKIASLIQSAVALYFEEHKDDLGIDGLVLVDQVFVGPDIKFAQVWVSFSPVEGSEKKFKLLNRGLTRLQSHLFKQMAMKRVPKLTLHLADPERQYNL